MSRSDYNARLQAKATTDATREQLRYQERQRIREEEAHSKYLEDFAELCESSLTKISDKKLAEFQARYPSSAPQHTLALHEWNRRLIARQARTSYWLAFIGVASGLLGIALGAWLESEPFGNQIYQEPADSPQTQAEEDPNESAPALLKIESNTTPITEAAPGPNAAADKVP